MKRAQLRIEAEAAIERLIDLLDRIDGDPDLEQAWPEGSAARAFDFPMEDDEDGHDAEARPFGRQVVTLNPHPRPTRVIARRRAAG